MSVLLLVDSSGGGTVRPPSDADRHELTATAVVDGVPVYAYRPGEQFVDAVAREFRRSWGRGGGGVRLVLTGCRDPRPAAEQLSRGRGVPVNVVHCGAADGHWVDALRSLADVTVTGWISRAAADRTVDDTVADAVRLVDELSAEYRKYADGLRDVHSAVDEVADGDGHGHDHVYSTIVQEFGDVRAVEPVLAAVLEHLCGADREEPAATTMADVGRWTSATAVVEHGDRAAEDALRASSLGRCSVADAADCARRTTRVAATFASAFWRGPAARPPTATDRVLAECLVENVRAAAAPELSGMGAEQFSVCLNAKFADTRRWSDGRPSAKCSAAAQSLFRPEIREPCEGFTAVNRLTDLMTAGDRRGDSVFGSSYLEHLEPYVLPQRLVEYASRYYGYQVRYFALTDTLVFRFTDGERGELVCRNHRYQLTGPRDFKQYHSEVFRMVDYLSGDRSDDSDNLPLSVNVPNVFRYRDIGYVDAHDDDVQYLSTNGRTKVAAEVYRLFGNDGEVPRDRKYRMRVVCDDDTWVTVHRGTTADGDERPTTEVTVGLSDGTVVAVTRGLEPECRFDVTVRTTDGWIVDDCTLTRVPLLEHRGSVVTVTLAEGTRIVAEYADPEELVCEAFVSDGTRVRMLTSPKIQYFRRDEQLEVATHAVGAKYLVCRRDLSGYEFVDDGVESLGRPSSSRCTVESSDDQVTVVRTLTRSNFDSRTSGLLDDALSVHLKSVGKLADQINANFPDTTGQIDSFQPLVTDT